MTPPPAAFPPTADRVGGNRVGGNTAVVIVPVAGQSFEAGDTPKSGGTTCSIVALFCADTGIACEHVVMPLLFIQNCSVAAVGFAAFLIII